MDDSCGGFAGLTGAVFTRRFTAPRHIFLRWCCYRLANGAFLKSMRSAAIVSRLRGAVDVFR